MKKSIIVPALALFTGALMLFSACSKHDGDCDGPRESQDKSKLDRKVRELVAKLPHFYYTKSIGSSTSTASPTGFDFSSPSTGFNFQSSPDGFNFSTTTGSYYFSSGSFGANAGGTVVAGNTSLDINYTFCWTATDSASGLNLFDMGNGGFSGVSSVVGVAGDFDQLATATDSTDFGDIFHGLAFYIVYDDQASGNYDIIDWLNDDLTDTTATDGNAFAFAFDFKLGRLYVSSDGSISVSGGAMNFNGEYLEVGGFIDDNGDFDINGDLTYRKVSGFGTMGCN
jgi:hypothetical protein